MASSDALRQWYRDEPVQSLPIGRDFLCCPPRPPSRARHTVLAVTLVLTAIAYLDRVCISMAAPAMNADLGISDLHMGYVVSAFTLAYALFEVPSGWLADRFDARLMLTRIVVWWSAMTAATGLVTGFGTLVAVRFLFRVGEAGAFPSMAWRIAHPTCGCDILAMCRRSRTEGQWHAAGRPQGSRVELTGSDSSAAAAPVRGARRHRARRGPRTPSRPRPPPPRRPGRAPAPDLCPQPARLPGLRRAAALGGDHRRPARDCQDSHAPRLPVEPPRATPPRLPTWRPDDAA